MTVSTQLISYETSAAELEVISSEFEKAQPEAVLRWALELFGNKVALATGFGAEGCVLVSLIAGIDKRARIFYLDTDLLFPETYALRDQLEAQYGVRFEKRATTLSLGAQAARYGERLWERRPDECCRLRKVKPLREMLGGLQAWITGVRREQSPTRAAAGIVERDAQFGLLKINPLALWSDQDLKDFIVAHDVPSNPLHELGYGSIGCVPCTTPVQIGEDTRAGRWRGTSKTECGIHEWKDVKP